MAKLSVIKFCLVPLILRLGLFLVCSYFLAILSLDVLIKLIITSELKVDPPGNEKESKKAGNQVK